MHFLELFLELSQQAIRRRPLSGRKKPYKEEALELIRLVGEHGLHLDRGLTKKMLCSLTGLSPIQLHHMFKRNFEMTYSQFMNCCRIEEAKQLLAGDPGGKLEMTEIAAQAGFGSLSAFNHQFKKIVDLTPTGFRFFHRHFREKTGMDLIEYRYRSLDAKSQPGAPELNR